MTGRLQTIQLKVTLDDPFVGGNTFTDGQYEELITSSSEDNVKIIIPLSIEATSLESISDFKITVSAHVPYNITPKSTATIEKLYECLLDAFLFLEKIANLSIHSENKVLDFKKPTIESAYSVLSNAFLSIHDEE